MRQVVVFDLRSGFDPESGCPHEVPENLREFIAEAEKMPGYAEILSGKRKEFAILYPLDPKRKDEVVRQFLQYCGVPKLKIPIKHLHPVLPEMGHKEVMGYLLSGYSSDDYISMDIYSPAGKELNPFVDVDPDEMTVSVHSWLEPFGSIVKRDKEKEHKLFAFSLISKPDMPEFSWLASVKTQLLLSEEEKQHAKKTKQKASTILSKQQLPAPLEEKKQQNVAVKS